MDAWRMEWVRKNQRRAIRRTAPMGCYVVRPSDGARIAERAIDLSQDGMLVASEADATVGEAVLVSFRATELGLWFWTDAIVARVARGRRLGDSERALGLSFGSLGAVSRLILTSHLRRRPPPLPNAFRDPRVDYAATLQKISASPCRTFEAC
jgi:hypothetical protein